MKKSHSNYPKLVNENLAGYNQAIEHFEAKVFPYITSIKELYNSLQLSEPFNDSIYHDIVYDQGKKLKETAHEKVRNIPPVIGTNYKQSIIEARKSVDIILNKIQNQTISLLSSFGRMHFKGACFQLNSVINTIRYPKFQRPLRMMS